MPQQQDGRRRRGRELEDAILRAAYDELAEVGYARLSMEGVAARARTGKQVLYRRWRNRAELVIAALRHRVGPITDHIPDTGDLRGDVLAALRLGARRFEEFGPEVVHGLLTEAADLDPQLFRAMRGVMTAIVERAAGRGEIPSADLSPRVITLPADLLRYELMLTRDPIPESTLVEIVDDVFLPLVHAAARR